MEECARDTLCSAKLGADPWARLGELYTSIEGGHCPDAVAAGLDHVGLRGKLGAIADLRSARDAIPAFVYRFLRCAPEDVPALAHFRANAGAPPPATGPNGSSLQILLLVGISEIYESPAPTLEAVQANLDGLRVSQGTGPLFAGAHTSLPRYAPDEYAGLVPTDPYTPILLMAGELDPRTPPRYAEQLGEELPGPHHYVLTPQGTHGQLRGGLIAGTKEHCGLHVVTSFMDEPLAAPDASCMEDVERLDFAGNTERATALFGTTDFWEN